MDQLADQLFISPATLINELPKVKSVVTGFDLVLKTKNNCVFLEGEEINKKKLISDLIYEESDESLLSVELIQKYLPAVDTGLLHQIITDALRKNHYFMDDYSLWNLILQLAIILERRQYEKTMAEPLDEDCSNIGTHIQSIIDLIIQSVENNYETHLSGDDKFQISLLILTRAVSGNVNHITLDQLNAFVGKEVLELFQLMKIKTKETFNISITNHDFIIRFSLHLKNLLIRLKNNVGLKNPQLYEIKNSYPFLYSVSVYLADIITQQAGFEVSEDEISYLALHLGFLIEERKNNIFKVRTVLLNPQLNVNGAFVEKKIAAIFEDSLHLVGCISSTEELDDFKDFDLLISTSPLPATLTMPRLQVSAFLLNKDITRLSKKIEDILKNRIKTKIDSSLRFLFKQELFFVGEPFKQKEELIEKVSTQLEKHGYVDSTFKEKLFKRERISPSAFLNIAMPHPLEMCSFKSGIAVSLHPNPLTWHVNKVNIVFVLAINSRDSLFYRDIFDFVTEIISEEANLNKLIRTTNFEEFITTLVSFAKV